MAAARRDMIFLAAVLLALLVLAPACAPDIVVSPSTFTPPAASPQQTSGDVVQAEWRQKWEEALSRAKQEGEMLIYLNAPSEARAAIPEAFDRKFGLKVNVVMGTAAELTTRLNSEYRAGIHQTDAILVGASTIWSNTKPLGLLSPMEPLLILPEAKDPGVWLGGKLPFFDKDRMVVAYLSQVIPHLVHNSNLVRPGEITSYLDLLKPEWKGKVAIFDPTIPSAANSAIALLSLEWGLDKTKELLISLLKQQEAVMTRDMRQQMDWVSRGKYSVAMWPQTPSVIEFLKVGAPLAAADIRERVEVGPSNGGLAVPTKPPHPNATTVFLNWFLSQEGQRLVVKTMGAPSTRQDVPPEGVASMFTLKPGETFFMIDEEFSTTRARLTEEWKKLLTQAGG